MRRTEQTPHDKGHAVRVAASSHHVTHPPVSFRVGRWSEQGYASWDVHEPSSSQTAGGGDGEGPVPEGSVSACSWRCDPPAAATAPACATSPAAVSPAASQRICAAAAGAESTLRLYRRPSAAPCHRLRRRLRARYASQSNFVTKTSRPSLRSPCLFPPSATSRSCTSCTTPHTAETDLHTHSLARQPALPQQRQHSDGRANPTGSLTPCAEKPEELLPSRCSHGPNRQQPYQ
eukprot:COSAG02_NODE_13157_length_1436_cov_2.418100_1_plen_233_part_00